MIRAQTISSDCGNTSTGLVNCKGMFLDILYVRAANKTERKGMIRVGKATYDKSNNWQLPKHMRQSLPLMAPERQLVWGITQVQLLNCTFLSLRSQHSFLRQSFTHSCHRKEHQPQRTYSSTQQTLSLLLPSHAFWEHSRISSSVGVVPWGQDSGHGSSSENISS